MEYNFRDIEKKWQGKWKESEAYKVANDFSKPKSYVLDMFPYPSGTGLHVGHPLGYIASDIYSRYKRLKGFNVLHPMGFDSFGLPAEQYALDTGQHPAETTKKNIATFKSQLDNIGFCYDWSREVQTSDPKYYKWTQWIFLQLFNSYFCHTEKKALPISLLVKKYETKGAMPKTGDPVPGKHFTAEQWNAFPEKEKAEILMRRRLAYCGYGEVNWCEALGTVLANDEVVNGVSERGGYPVVKKTLRQWYLRITEYADRLLEGLETVDFSDAMKEMQTNWIGKSSGAEILFQLSLASPPAPLLAERGAFAEPEMSGKFFKTADKNSWGILKDLSRENRKNKTEAEDILWQELRNNQLGHKVRRQHVIDGFIIDFAFLQKRLLIEVDGGYHEEKDQKAYDEARTEYLEAHGYKILRFTNEEVINNKDAVLTRIKEELDRQSSEASNTPLSGRRGVGGEAMELKVYTTRPDTIFGVDFMVIAPEHELVEKITTPEQKQAVDEYITYVKSRSERERQAEKKITGVFTGAHALNPFDQREIPIWISEYVLAGYGTGAIMAVPCGDERDHKFAKHFDIPVTNIIGKYYNGEEANPTKDAILENSDFLNDLVMSNAIEVVIDKLQELGIGVKKVNYKMRDAAFSRQRYWGEPFPVKWINGIAYPLDESELPLELPHVDSYKPGPDGEGPLANIPEWVHRKVKLSKQPGSSQVSPPGGDLEGALETNTMPGYAGSSWYFLRYMDPHNDKAFCDRKVADYWNQVDIYIGGTEHAVGHLLYSRMWTKVLYDLGYIGHDEPYKKLVNQGMIQGSSRFVYRSSITRIEESNAAIGMSFKEISSPLFISYNCIDEFEKMSFGEQVNFIKSNAPNWDGVNKLENEKGFLTLSLNKLHVDVNIVDGNVLDIEAFKKWREEYKNAAFILEDGKYICGSEVEKMSKSKFNTVNPDDLVLKYGADTFRMYEMFLGPVEMSKPWDTKGIEGVHRFLKKLWRLFYDDIKGKIWTEEKANEAELKVLHRTIRKIEEDTERFSFNTGVSGFMIAVNELTDLKCHKKEVLEKLLILLTPYAPHISEELWHQLGNTGTILDAPYPKWEQKYLVETSKEYPISINGKLRTTMHISLDASQPEVETMVLENDIVKKWLEGKPPKKIIFVKGKMVNVVI
jgi:leucyl-tRNA synthetase